MAELDLEKLLGGFAADTLTAEEKQQLYTAALHDQQLFNALADEQGLKELLADPVVRRRLLQALQKRRSTTPSSPWLDWFRRPAGIAWAGGLAAAVFAVILGTKVYQDSLRQVGRSVATEEARPVAPPAAVSSASRPVAPLINEPEVRAKDHSESPAVFSKKEALADKMAKQETTAMAKPEKKRTPNSRTDSPLRQPEQDALRKQAESMTDKLAKSKEEAPATDDQKPASASSASASMPALTKVPATAAPTSQVISALSARSLFYGETVESDAGLMTEEQEHSQSTQQFGRFEQKRGQLTPGKPGKATGFTKPLGIRYSRVTSGINGPHSDRNVGTTNQAGSIDLIIDANQDGYLQVWGEAESLQHHLLFPMPKEEPFSSKLTAYQRRTILVAAGYGAIIIRFSRVPFNSSTKQAIALSGRSSLSQLQESVTTDEASGSQEPTTYVVNQDLSLLELLVRIPIVEP